MHDYDNYHDHPHHGRHGKGHRQRKEGCGHGHGRGPGLSHASGEHGHGGRKGQHRGRHGGGMIGGKGAGGKGSGGMGRRRRLDGDTLRLIILALLEEGARHGYDLIKAVEAKALGHYSPSPGVVYPALTFLEEADLIASAPEGSKKVYALTETGRDHLAANRAAADAALNALEALGKRMEQAWAGETGGDRDIPGAVPELNDARRALKRAMAAEIAKGEAAQKRLAEVLQKAIAEISGDEGTDIDL